MNVHPEIVHRVVGYACELVQRVAGREPTLLHALAKPGQIAPGRGERISDLRCSQFLNVVAGHAPLLASRWGWDAGYCREASIKSAPKAVRRPSIAHGSVGLNHQVPRLGGCTTPCTGPRTTWRGFARGWRSAGSHTMIRSTARYLLRTKRFARSGSISFICLAMGLARGGASMMSSPSC